LHPRISASTLGWSTAALGRGKGKGKGKAALHAVGQLLAGSVTGVSSADMLESARSQDVVRGLHQHVGGNGLVGPGVVLPVETGEDHGSFRAFGHGHAFGPAFGFDLDLPF
jgi:hypothetical protein